MKILLNILLVLGFGLTLFHGTRTNQMTHPGYHDDPSLSLYERGNASEEVCLEILEQLKYFNEGYLLDLPLRVSGIMVKEEQDWKFQQLQFQFDLNIQWILYVIVLLALLLLGSIIRLIFVIVRSTGKGQA